MRRISAILATAAALLAAVSPAANAQASAGGANNIVFVSNTGDGSTAQRSSLLTSPFGGDALTSANIADAAGHDCAGCRTVAVAAQAVFTFGSPGYFAPENAAVATNSNCDGCDTFAYAWQYVVSAPGPVHLTTEGQDQVATLRRQIADTTAQTSLPDDELEARLDGLTAQYKDVIDHELEAAGYMPNGTVTQHVMRGS